MKNKTRNARLGWGIAAAALMATSMMVQADALDANGFLTPSFRGSANSEFGYWNGFTNAYNGVNTPDAGSTSSNAGLVQTTPPADSGDYAGYGAFLIGSPGDIYSFATTNNFLLSDSTPFTLGTVLLQTDTSGNELDYSSILLSYSDGVNTFQLAPILDQELSRSSSDMGGYTVSTLFQWDLTGLGITDYSIAFNASDVSLGLHAISLDTADHYVAIPAPEPSTFAMAGMGVALFGLVARRMKRKGN